MDSGKNLVVGQQQDLELFAVKEIESNGIQMGILNDGTPYLTLNGLSRFCGASTSVLSRLTTDWLDQRTKPRGSKIDKILRTKGLTLTSLYTTIQSNGVEARAYPDRVCMAILEYYAFDAESPEFDNSIAKQRYRDLAEYSLKRFIYLSLGIDPENPLRSAWQCFQERLQLNANIPFGFFSIFSEMADLTLRMINTGFNLGPASIPDISIGITWGKHWIKNNLSEKYGERTKHPHRYPDWFPQSRAGAVDAWIYPDDALGEFRRWLQKIYLPQKFPAYIESKIKDGAIPKVNAGNLLTQVKKPELPNKH